MNCEEHTKNSQNRIKTLILTSTLRDYSDSDIIVRVTVTNNGAGADDAAKRLLERNKRVLSKNCKPFIDFSREVNNTQINCSEDMDVVMLLYSLIETNHNYSKGSRSL